MSHGKFYIDRIWPDLAWAVTSDPTSVVRLLYNLYFSSKSMKLIVHVSKLKNVIFQNAQQVVHQRQSAVVNCLTPKLTITITPSLRLVSTDMSVYCKACILSCWYSQSSLIEIIEWKLKLKLFSVRPNKHWTIKIFSNFLWLLELVNIVLATIKSNRPPQPLFVKNSTQIVMVWFGKIGVSVSFPRIPHAVLESEHDCENAAPTQPSMM